MEEAKLKENEVSDLIYQTKFFFWIKVIFFCVLIFAIALSIHFPIRDYAKIQVSNAITKNPRCPISYKRMNLELFLPYIQLKDILLPPRCFNQSKGGLNLDMARFKFNFLSFWPVGAKFHGIAKAKDGSSVNIYPKLGLTEHQIRIAKTTIKGALLSSMGPYPNLLKGDFKADALFDLKGQNLKSGNVKVTSKDLFIPEQNINSFPIPQLNLKNFLLALSFDSKEARLTSLKIGNSESDIELEFTGDIIPNLKNMRQSKINLFGKIRFSELIFEKISLLPIFLKGKNPENGFYKVKIGGTLGLPIPKFL